MRLVAKKRIEYSDDQNTFYFYTLDDLIQDVEKFRKRNKILPLTYVYVEGDDAVKEVFGLPLEHCVGNRIILNGICFIANYKKSEQCLRAGRAKAYHLIKDKQPLPFFTPPDSKKLKSINDDPDFIRFAFDIETGGASKIRCISFYGINTDGHTVSCYIDCRDIKSNKEKRALLTSLFMSSIPKIAHYGIHDITEICKMLKIPRFDLYKDTIWFDLDVEFRSLRYLSGVYLGCEPYKHMLEEANSQKDFDKLVKYCCLDSYYTYQLSLRLKLKSSRLLNQVYAVMFNPPKLRLEKDIFSLYPQFVGRNKKELKESIHEINPIDLSCLRNTINPPKPILSIHTSEGLKVVVPDELTYDGDLWFIGANGETSVDRIKVGSIKYKDPVLDAKRHINKIEPKRNIGEFDIDPEDVFLVNEDVCLSKVEKEGWVKCTFNEVKGLFK